MRSNIIDLAGKRFSRLIVIEIDSKRSEKTKRTHWMCQCDCGNITTVRGDFLRTENTKSCGCLQSETWVENQFKFNDLTGKRFDMLFVIELSFNKNSIYFWKCKCDCGNISIVKSSYLKSEYKSKSCGCLCKGKGMPTKGVLHWNWKGGISSENRNIRNSLDYRLWRISIFERDNYICQECGSIGGKLSAHHIKSFANFPEERFDINNGVTLCDICHEKTENYRGKANRKLLA